MQDKLRNIKAFVFDIDGVLSNGSIILTGPTLDGLVRTVDAKDSFAIRAAAAKGYIIGIISGGENAALVERCTRMGVEAKNLHLGVRGKLKVFEQFCSDNNLKAGEVAYFGDDIPDTQVLRACGLGVAPSDAVPEAKAAADYIASCPGGKGAAREGVEMVLKAQGAWVFDESKFEQIY